MLPLALLLGLGSSKGYIKVISKVHSVWRSSVPSSNLTVSKTHTSYRFLEATPRLVNKFTSDLNFKDALFNAYQKNAKHPFDICLLQRLSRIFRLEAMDGYGDWPC